MDKAATYILRCADNKLYVGSTTNIEERLKRHKAGYASKFSHFLDFILEMKKDMCNNKTNLNKYEILLNLTQDEEETRKILQ